MSSHSGSKLGPRPPQFYEHLQRLELLGVQMNINTPQELVQKWNSFMTYRDLLKEMKVAKVFIDFFQGRLDALAETLETSIHSPDVMFAAMQSESKRETSPTNEHKE